LHADFVMTEPGSEQNRPTVAGPPSSLNKKPGAATGAADKQRAPPGSAPGPPLPDFLRKFVPPGGAAPSVPPPSSAPKPKPAPQRPAPAPEPLPEPESLPVPQPSK
jgi:preprotein translocase subunit SecD